MRGDTNDSRPSNLLVALGAVVLLAVVALVMASLIKISASPELYNRAIEATDYIESNRTKYASCYSNITGTGRAAAELKLTALSGFNNSVFDYVALSDAYFTKVSELCAETISKYEAEYRTLVVTNHEIDKSEVSLLDKILGREISDVNTDQTYLNEIRNFTQTELVLDPDNVDSYYPQA